ncbi:patatin-like phospholipase family protein [Deferribacter thermophilus]|uniref:patatin-like phospholipase family protein n=1 Tax=Deferribacter thermophilus TaxID=53573 RepID=UPI003C214A27
MFKKVKRDVSLALGSGSAKGLAHIGVIDYLLENNFRIKAVAGSSIGSVIASYYAFNKLDLYKEFVLSLDKKKVFSLFDINFIPTKGLIDGDKIFDFFMESIGNVNIEDAPIPLYIVATDLESGKPIVLKKGSLTKAVRASISIPGIFSTVSINGQILVDGGVSNPLPITVLSKNNHKNIIAVNLNAKLKTNNYNKSPNIIATFYRSFSIMNYYQSECIINSSKYYKLIEPDLEEIGMFDYHLAEKIIREGYNATKRIFER